MPIPFLDLSAATAELRGELDEAVNRVISGGRFILGPEVEAFEDEFARYCGVRHCIAVSNGYDALHLVVRAWGIGPGDEVIVPSHTFVATWLAVSQAGATPVPVDVDERTFNIDPTLVEDAITSRTRAIIPVHLYGQPADMAPIRDLAARRGIHVLEDAAQAHGARYRGRRVGGLGEAAAFSFYPGKNLGALGDGGAVTTDDDDLARRVRLLGNYGSERKYEHLLQGMNCRLDELQAAVLRAKLPLLDEWNERRRALAHHFGSGIARRGLELPYVPDGMEPVWHLYVARSTVRDELQAALVERGVQTLIHYPVPPHLQPAYAGLRPRLPVAERLGGQVISLPIGPHVSTEQKDRIIAAVNDATSSLDLSAS